MIQVWLTETDGFTRKVSKQELVGWLDMDVPQPIAGAWLDFPLREADGRERWTRAKVAERDLTVSWMVWEEFKDERKRFEDHYHVPPHNVIEDTVAKEDDWERTIERFKKFRWQIVRVDGVQYADIFDYDIFVPYGRPDEDSGAEMRWWRTQEHVDTSEFRNLDIDPITGKTKYELLSEIHRPLPEEYREALIGKTASEIWETMGIPGDKIVSGTVSASKVEIKEKGLTSEVLEDIMKSLGPAMKERVDDDLYRAMMGMPVYKMPEDEKRAGSLYLTSGMGLGMVNSRNAVKITGIS